MRLRHLIPVFALSATLAGCLNASDTITGTGDDPTPDLGDATGSSPRSSTGPSVTGLDRRNWDAVVVTAPRGQVEHQPTYAEPLVMNGGSARNGETFPTVADATRLGCSPGAAATEGAAEFVWPAGLLLVSPARMVMGMPPWLTMQGPGQASGVLPPAQATALPGLWVWVAPPPRTSP